MFVISVLLVAVERRQLLVDAVAFSGKFIPDSFYRGSSDSISPFEYFSSIKI